MVSGIGKGDWRGRRWCDWFCGRYWRPGGTCRLGDGSLGHVFGDSKQGAARLIETGDRKGIRGALWCGGKDISQGLEGVSFWWPCSSGEGKAYDAILGVVCFPGRPRRLASKLSGCFEQLRDVPGFWSARWGEEGGIHRGRAHLVFGKYLGHVLVEPVHLVAGREGELVDFRMGNGPGRVSLLGHPGRRPDRHARCSSHRHFDGWW